MLKLWRRHRKDCKYDSRDDMRCACPIFSEWRVNGKRVRKELGTGDWRVAQTRAQQWEIAGVPASGEPITIESAFDRYLTNLRARNLKESTIRKHDLMRRQLTDFCKKRGLVFVGQLSFDRLTEFRADWKLCPRSAAKALERLRSFLKFCVKCDWLPKNPAQDIDPPKVDDADVLPFSTEEVTKILKACDSFNGNGARLKALSNLMLYSGLRISDASTISRAAFVETKGSWSVVLRTLKTRTQVSIPLPPDIAKAVLAIPGEHPFWSGASSPANCASVWQEAFRKLFAHAGIKNATPHRWRHTFSKNLLVAGVSLQTVSTLLGHRKLAITERYYARFVPERQDAIDSQVRKSWALRGHS
jgi:integrase/recombinase XerD